MMSVVYKVPLGAVLLPFFEDRMACTFDGHRAIPLITNNLPLRLKVQLDVGIGQLIVYPTQIAAVVRLAFRKMTTVLCL